METKLTYTQMMNLNTKSIKFDGCVPVECEGSGKERKGGLCILWKNHIDFTSTTLAIIYRVTSKRRRETTSGGL